MCAVIIIAVLLLVFAGIACVIKLTSRGPVIFKQRRVGRNKSEFFMLKFRTMYLEAPRDIPTHLFENPERYITPVGRFLRKASLDELPQLFNILKGEMSFVGPRPALYNQYDLISLRDRYGVNSIRPGITGWAQVNGRDELDIPAKAEYDRYYKEHMSLWLDLKILLLTFKNALSGKGVIEGKQAVENKSTSAV